MTHFSIINGGLQLETQDSIKSKHHTVPIKSTIDGTAATLSISADHSNPNQYIISLDASSPNDSFIMTSEHALQLSKWLWTRDRYFHKFTDYVKVCADTIARRLNLLPRSLRNIGYDDNLIPELLDDVVSKQDNGIQDLLLDEGNRKIFIDLIDLHLGNRGLKFRSPNSRGVRGFLRSSIMLSNVSYTGLSTDPWFKWVDKTIKNLIPTSLKPGSILALLLESCRHAIKVQLFNDDHAASIESQGLIDVVNVMYLLNRLSPKEGELFITTMHNAELAEPSDRSGAIEKLVQSWQYSREYRLEDFPGGTEEPIQALSLIMATAILARVDSNWGSEVIKDFAVSQWNPEVIYWINN